MKALGPEKKWDMFPNLRDDEDSPEVLIWWWDHFG